MLSFGVPSATPVGYTPAQISHAYGFDQISFNGVTGDGRGQTIAIVDPYDDPNIGSDLTAFDTQFGLSAPPSFTKVNQFGKTTYPATNTITALEISLDVEWCNAIAPQANILLVESNSASFSDEFAAVSYAKSQPGVVVVSMSFGGPEFSGESGDDSTFTTPAGHVGGAGLAGGVTFVAGAGDTGAPPDYPATSPNVLAVGGTTLYLNSNNTWASETGWSLGSDPYPYSGDAGGGGVSAYESEPSYQTGVQFDG